MLLSPDGVDRLREALTGAGFTATGIAERLGPAATVGRRPQRLPRRAARHRGRRPARHADPAVRLRADRAGGGGRRRARAAAARRGARRRAGRARTGTACGRASTSSRTGTPGGSSPTCRPVPARASRSPRDHVLGVGGASTTLAGATVRRPVGHRARPRHRLRRAGAAPGHRTPGRVTATDLSARALRFAATTAALNGQHWELLHGDLVAPVARPPLRPGGQQPAVRGRPGHDHAHLPRLRPGRRRGLRRAGRRRARPAHRRRARCSSWPTGCTWPARTGTTGSPAGSPAPAWTPG